VASILPGYKHQVDKDLAYFFILACYTSILEG